MWPMSAATPIREVQCAIPMCVVHRKRTGSKADIVEGELSDPGVKLEEQRQRLADTTGSTEDGDLGRL